MAHTFEHGDFPTGLVLDAKARTGRSVSVCIPARDEGSTVGSVVRAVLAAVDQVAADLRPPEREAMRRHFVTTSRYEWMFWDMGLRREAWPSW